MDVGRLRRDAPAQVEQSRYGIKSELATLEHKKRELDRCATSFRHRKKKKLLFFLRHIEQKQFSLIHFLTEIVFVNVTLLF